MESAAISVMRQDTQRELLAKLYADDGQSNILWDAD